VKRDRIEQALKDAIEAGVLPAGAGADVPEERPWPVVLLTALGAWLAAIPLAGAVAAALHGVLSETVGQYSFAVLLLAGGVAVLRKRSLALFAEQLAVPALLAGAGLLSLALSDSLPSRSVAGLLSLIVLAVAAVIGQSWLRVLLGFAAACLAVVAVLPSSQDGFGVNAPDGYWLGLHAVFITWLLAGQLQHRVLNNGARARAAAGIESISAGWLLATLAGMSLWSGTTFLLGASVGGGIFSGNALGPAHSSIGANGQLSRQVVSVVLAFGAAWVIAWRWPSIRQLWCCGAGLVAMALCCFMPMLGAVLLALALCGSSGRRVRTTVAAAAAVWIVGAFYYQLSGTLAAKAALLVGAGVVLGALAVAGSVARGAALRSRPGGILSMFPLPAGLSTPMPRTAQAGIALSALLVLVVANLGIWQKEELIAHGDALFVELAPVDPRSLMQGDYMALNYHIANDVAASERALALPVVRGAPPGAKHPSRTRIIVARDARGVATFRRLDDGSARTAGEIALEMKRKGGRWMLASDAWFFEEGEGDRWATARYGEFRVAPDGRALLVGLRGADLQPL
jgi:uncharacterized membrane-anchored protein